MGEAKVTEPAGMSWQFSATLRTLKLGKLKTFFAPVVNPNANRAKSWSKDMEESGFLS